MQNFIAFDQGLSRYKPLDTLICYDDFDNGTNGWVDLTPNFTLPGFNARDSIIDKTNWGPTMLSTATFPYVGSHGSMNGMYSLKLTTRPVAAAHQDPPAAGSMGHAIKRLSMHKKRGLTQLEMWYAYKPEQDRIGLGPKDVRAFGVFVDVQDDSYRYFMGVRYINSANGEMQQRWQFMQAADVTDQEWAYGTSGDWCVRGIDPIWYGCRYPDGGADGYVDVPDGRQQLCYNESDDKINWLYLRLLLDLQKREYVELQSADMVFDLRGQKPTLVKPYARIEGLLNPSVWVEADTDRRAFMFVDSVVISVE